MKGLNTHHSILVFALRTFSSFTSELGGIFGLGTKHATPTQCHGNMPHSAVVMVTCHTHLFDSEVLTPHKEEIEDERDPPDDLEEVIECYFI